jgi:hypothetical protein
MINAAASLPDVGTVNLALRAITTSFAGMLLGER